jgi:hypothetical protein
MAIESTVQERLHEQARRSQARSLALPVALFLLALISPFLLEVGGARLSAYRIVLLVMTPVLMYFWMVGRAGRIRLADVAVLLLCLWVALSFTVVHGPGVGIEAGGIFFVETMGAYLLARVFIRSMAAFRAMAKLLFWMAMVFLPFAVIEATTGKNILLDFASSIWDTHIRIRKEPRLGLDRVQATFEHPILFGVFCGNVIGLTHIVLGYGQSFLRRSSRTALVFLTAAFSLSAGPLTGMVAQFNLIVWNTIFAGLKSRWIALAGLGAAGLVFIEIAATRSAPVIFINLFAFNEHSAYMRVHIWNFGTASILNHPVFGIGFGEWERPSWMSASIDMFWIVHGVRHGIPAMAMTLLAFFAIYLPLAFRRNLGSFRHDCRLGLLFSLTGFFLMGWTVHYWNAVYALFLFMLGSGVWLLDEETADDPDMAEAEAPPSPGRTDAAAPAFSRRLEGASDARMPETAPGTGPETGTRRPPSDRLNSGDSTWSFSRRLSDRER